MLQSPEVIIHGDEHGDTYIYEQKPLDLGGYDPGEMVLLGNLGLNPVCSSIIFHNMPVVSHELVVKVSIRLTDHWNEKEDFVQEMKDRGVTVAVVPHPYTRDVTSLDVVGIQNIFAVGEALRDRFTWSKLSVDELYRPIIHPELLGVMLDELADFAGKKLPVEGVFHRGAYRGHDWTP